MNDKGILGEKEIRVLTTGIEPTTLRLLPGHRTLVIGLAVQEGPWRNLLFSLQEIWFEICQLNLVPYLGIFTPLLPGSTYH